MGFPSSCSYANPTLLVVPSGAKKPFAGAEGTQSNLVFDKDCNPLQATSEVKPLVCTPLLIFPNTKMLTVSMQGTAKGFGGNINVVGLDGPIQFTAATLGLALGSTGISFKFQGKEFSDCDCQDDSSGVTGKEACRCEFDCPPAPASGIISGQCGFHVTQVLFFSLVHFEFSLTD